MKRWVVGLLVLVVVGLGGGVFLLSKNLNEIVRTAIESQGSAALGTAVRVGGVELDLQNGKGTLRDLRIANPPGSGAGNLIEFGRVSLGIDTSSALAVVSGDSRHFIIDQVSLEDPQATVVVGPDGSTNVQALQKRMASEPSSGPSVDAGGEPLLLTLQSVSMAGAKVQLDTTGVDGKSRSLSVPDFSMRNVGGRQGKPAGDVGVAVATGFASQITTAVVKSTAQTQLDRVIDKHLGGESGKAAKGLLKQVLGGG
jgi:uncharacterized protein involved in outer membrane biogenesis